MTAKKHSNGTASHSIRHISPAELEAIKARTLASDQRIESNLKNIGALTNAVSVDIAEMAAIQAETSNRLDRSFDRLDRFDEAIKGHMQIAEVQTALINLAKAMSLI